MRLKPIPKSLMPDTIVVRVPKDGEYRGKFEMPVGIENVRFDSTESLNPNQYAFSEGSRGLIFIDAVNSVGAFEIPAGARITLGDEDYLVVKTTSYAGFYGRMHHWEVEVA